MNEQGEEIVILARDLLNTDRAEHSFRKKNISITMNYKTICFTTLLAAAGETLVATSVHEYDRVLNKYERLELKALVFYAAKVKGIKEDVLRKEVESQIGSIAFDTMNVREFQIVRHYLQEKAR